MNRYQQIIWDWNGTILNDTQVAFSCICQLLEAENKPALDFEYFSRNVRFPIDQFYIEIGLFDQQADFAEWEDRYHQLYDSQVLKEASLHTDIVQLLKTIFEASVPQSILSAREHHKLLQDIEFFGLASYFTTVQGSQPKLSFKGKLDYAKEVLDSNAKRVLLIGDTLHDYEIAQAIGADCLLVAQGINHFDLLATSGAQVLREHREIYNYL